jgi:hypothetical protein
MHSAVLKEIKYQETMRTEAGIFMDMNIYIKLAQNSKWKISEE